MNQTDKTAQPADELAYGDLVQEGEQLSENSELTANVEPIAEPKPRPKWPFVLLGGALLGFGASAAFSWHVLRPAPAEDPDYTSRLSALSTRIAKLENAPAPLPARAAPRIDLGPLERRLDALEARPAPAPAPVMDDALVARLEALQADGFDTAPPVDLAPLEARLDTLEARLAGFRADGSASSGTLSDLSDTLSSLAARIDVLEAKPAPDLAAPAFVTADIPSFPAEVLRDGARAMGGGGLFSKHIRVKSEDDPLTLIDGIEADLADGRPREAIAKFDRLPSELRSLARAWRADAQSALP